MTIDDLKNVRRHKLRIEALQDRIERLRSRTEYTQQQFRECSRGNPMRDRLAEHVADLDELEHELTCEMIALEKLLMRVDAALMELPENTEKILRLRYVEGMAWERVARKARYSTRQCRDRKSVV